MLEIVLLSSKWQTAKGDTSPVNIQETSPTQPRVGPKKHPLNQQPFRLQQFNPV